MAAATSALITLPSTFEAEYSTDDGTTWVTIPEVIGFDIGNIEADEHDVTSFSSTGDFREFKYGLKQASDGNMRLLYLIDHTAHKAIRDLAGTNTIIKLRGTTTHEEGSIEKVTFNARIRSWGAPRELNERVEVTVGFKMTGAPTYAAS